MNTSKLHWDSIYKTKASHQVSWTQEIPQTSLNFIHGFPVDKNASIIDVGGGESRLVDFLLLEGYTNITVLDISEEALNKTKARLGKYAPKVTWVVSDVTTFMTAEKFDIWHDRATFHFLTSPEDIERYIALAARLLKHDGFMAIGTFSENGPTKCSGLPIRQYSENQLEQALTGYFKKIRCVTEDHVTPFNTIQNFLFCSFQKAA